MAIVQPYLFGWQDVESSSEIQRFHVLMSTIDDEPLMEVLEAERKNGRDDFPLRCVWNAMLAMLVFRHDTLASLISELGRNGELRQACGFSPFCKSVPSRFVFMRLREKLVEHQDLLTAMFAKLVSSLGAIIGDLGLYVAVDAKALLARGKQDKEAGLGVKTVIEDADDDGQADEASKEKMETVTVSWNGFKLHLLCDSQHEMPLAFEVTQASAGDSPQLLPLLQTLQDQNPHIAQRIQELSADSAYDDAKIKRNLHEVHEITPLIPPRDLGSEKMNPLNDQKSDTIYISGTGEVVCKINPFAASDKEKYCQMQHQGFEKDRQTQKFRCPAAAFGVTCNNQQACRSQTKDQGFGRVVRVPLKKNPRIHLPTYRHSQAFKEKYKRRTSIERIFSRMDNLFGFERPCTLGLKRTQVHVTLAFISMLAIALGWIELGQAEKMRHTRAA